VHSSCTLGMNGHPVPVNNTYVVCFLMSCTTSVCRRADVVCILFIQHTCDWLVGRHDARSSLPYHHLRCITTPLCRTSAQTEFSRVAVLQGSISGLTYCFAMFRPSHKLSAKGQVEWVSIVVGALAEFFGSCPCNFAEPAEYDGIRVLGPIYREHPPFHNLTERGESMEALPEGLAETSRSPHRGVATSCGNAAVHIMSMSQTVGHTARYSRLKVDIIV
jgi:hypothetical protein